VRLDCDMDKRLRQHRTKTAVSTSLIPRLLLHICLHIFRHIAPKLLGKRQLAVVVLVQSDEKSAYLALPNTRTCTTIFVRCCLNLLILHLRIIFYISYQRTMILNG
jgi:hypothetical protein